MKISFDDRRVWWVVYYLLIVLKRWVLGWWIVYWLLGGLAAYFFSWVDRLAWVYIYRPEHEVSLAVKRLLTERHFKAAGRLLKARADEMERLVGLSVLFLLVWLPLALFMLTSSASWFGKGLVMGIGLRGAFHLVQHWEKPEWLSQHVFWQVKREIPWSEMQWWLLSFLTGFGVLSLVV